jgi:beta-galactosidase/beta-glucuronidase
MLLYHPEKIIITDMEQLWSEFGEKVNRDHPLSEHPNPYMQRDGYFSLNGPWDFAMTKKREKPAKFTDKIIVPFAVETALSGIKKHVSSDDFLHYEKSFDLPSEWVGKGVLLHLDAVDQICDVFLNGHFIGHHESGYSPLVIFIQYALQHNVIDVTVTDDTDSAVFPRGKQANYPSGIWYTPTSGIWQSVWLESVPSDGYVESLELHPDFDEQKLTIKAVFEGIKQLSEVECYYRGQLVAKSSFDQDGVAELDFKYDFYPWSPDSPALYSLLITSGDDLVHSYFAFRKIGILQKGKYHYITLNGKPLFLSGLLDQGYWPESGLTPPSDAAMVSDISFAKKAGFNFLRKHIKIEPLRWYYHCDKLGILVGQDFVNGGSPYSNFLISVRPFLDFNVNDTTHKKLGRLSQDSRERFVNDMKTTLKTLRNVPSIFMWTIFNEGWGQFDDEALTDALRKIDPTRLIDSASGWYDKGVGDFRSRHIYFRPPWIFNDHRRILSLSEFGGYSLKVPQHVYSNRIFGYKICRSFASFNRALQALYRKHILHLISYHGLGLCVLTQLSDVEEETNGMLTYDRRIIKLNVGEMRLLNLLCAEHFSKALQKVQK